MKKVIEKSIGLYLNILGILNPTLAAKKGFNLFCNPMCKPLKPYQKTFLETGLHSTLNFENTKIQTYKWGSGSKKVLLIHGWASHSFRWKATIEHLIENDFTVYAFDAPAHGLSSGKILHLVMYSRVIDLYLKNYTEIDYIVSHSIGGFATIFWLNQNKDNHIKKVVVMGAPGEATDFFNFYKTVLGITDKTLNILIDKFVTLLGHKPSYFSASSFAKELNTRALIIHDKKDFDTSYENSVKLHQNWKNSKLILTEGLGHSLRGDTILKNLTDFIVS